MTADTLKPWDALHSPPEEEIARLQAAAKAHNVAYAVAVAVRGRTFTRALSNGRYDETHQQLADGLGFSTDKVRRALLALTETGWLETVEAAHGPGKHGGTGRAPVRKVVAIAEHHANPERHEAGLTVVPDADLDEGGSSPARRGGARNQAIGARNQAIGARSDATLIESSFIEKPPTSLNETSVTAAKSGQGERRNLDDQCRAAGIDPTNLTALDKCKALAAASADEPDSSPPEALTEPPQPMPGTKRRTQVVEAATRLYIKHGGSNRAPIKFPEKLAASVRPIFARALDDYCEASNDWRRWANTANLDDLASALCSKYRNEPISISVAEALDNPKPRETSSDRQRLYA